MGPRELAASSGLAPWSTAADRYLSHRIENRGSRRPAHACCLPRRRAEGVTLTISPSGKQEQFLQKKSNYNLFRFEFRISTRIPSAASYPFSDARSDNFPITSSVEAR